MIRQSKASDFEEIYDIINNGAHAYKGVIPAEYWKEPYMSRDELRGNWMTVFRCGFMKKMENWVGVMGIQHRQNVTLIRHAYVCTTKQHQGIGGNYYLIYGTYSRTNPDSHMSNAVWAVAFYENMVSGFFQ